MPGGLGVPSDLSLHPMTSPCGGSFPKPHFANKTILKMKNRVALHRLSNLKPFLNNS